MDQLKQLAASLSLRQKISLLGAAAAVILGLWWLSRWNSERDFRPLYTGLAAEDAGAVVAKLRETNVDYRVGENGTSVLVPSEKVAELRLQMAAAGLPKTGRIGFELFDKTNFGITEFTEQVNFRRAVEGELERSVMSLAEVERARVHVTFPKNSVFLESRQPAKASVLLQLRTGARLSPGNVIAIAHLVSSAVESLTPEAVSILDMQGNLLSRPRKSLSEEEALGEASLDYRQKVERDLLSKINSTLEPLLGPDKFRAGVFVECDFTSGEQSEETFDPTRSVMVTAQRSEDISGVAAASGIPGTASNLPRPAVRPGSSGAGVTRRTENISYQTSRTIRKVHLPQGTIKRVSISLLVDQHVRWEGSGATAKRVVEPPSPEKMKIIRDLVAGVSGFSAERGDQIIVETLPFEPAVPLNAMPDSEPTVQTPPGLAFWRWPAKLEWTVVTKIAAGAAAALVLGGVLLLFLRRRARRKKKAATMVRAIAGGGEAAGAIEGDSDDFGKRLQDQLAEQAALKEKQTLEALHSLKLPTIHTKKSEVLIKHISEEAKKDPATAAQIIRSWLNETEI
jgi:flagellar M-ring protein FliF